MLSYTIHTRALASFIDDYMGEMIPSESHIQQATHCATCTHQYAICAQNTRVTL